MADLFGVCVVMKGIRPSASGAVRTPTTTPEARKLLIALDKLANTDGHRDGTKYGLARTATRSFHAYHLCAISTAIVTAHAEILLQAADARAAAALRDTDLSGVSD